MPRTTPSAPAAAPEPGFLRANLAPSAGVGVIMGFIAGTEGAGPGYGTVVGVAGCAAVLGMLAVKRALNRPARAKAATAEKAKAETAAAKAGRSGAAADEASDLSRV